ncbi:MAG: hypothetical protein IJY33_03660 [Oscillospiraceae bacterium]|nr:hypothetical protein [Oscillospiraceae bacterium]
MEISAVLVMAVIIEAIIAYVKTWVVEKKIQWQQIVAVFFGIVISFAYSLDIPALVGIESGIAYVGNVLTGILISRGSNYIHDLYKNIISKKGLSANNGVEI